MGSQEAVNSHHKVSRKQKAMAAGHWWEQIAMQATSPDEEKLKQKGDIYVTRDSPMGSHPTPDTTSPQLSRLARPGTAWSCLLHMHRVPDRPAWDGAFLTLPLKRTAVLATGRVGSLLLTYSWRRARAPSEGSSLRPRCLLEENGVFFRLR